MQNDSIEKNESMTAESAVTETETTDEIVEVPADGTKVPGKKRSVFRKILVSLLIVAVVLSAGIVGGFKILALYPYAITDTDGEVICYVKDKETAGKAVRAAVKKLNKNNGDILVVSLGDSIKVDRADSLSIEKEKIVPAKEATRRIVDNAKLNEGNDDPDEGVTIVSLKTEKRKFMPETIYEKDEESLAGTTVVKEEGKEGKKEVTVSVTTVNGEVSEREDLESVTLDEGVNPVIVKGVLGVPDGEDWKTYTGEPVANDGGVITVTAQQYVGKVKYVRGGTSLATGVDCVGFVRAIYRLYGINLPATLGSQGRHVSYSEAKPGDIIIYSKHVGIYIGDGQMVDASSYRGISVGPVSSKRVVDVRRIID